MAQGVQAAHGDQHLGRLVERDATLVVALSDGDLVVTGLTDEQACDLLALVLAVAVLPVDQAAQLALVQALDLLAIADNREALAATAAAARGLATGGHLGLRLLHGCLLHWVGARARSGGPLLHVLWSCLTVDNCEVYTNT